MLFACDSGRSATPPPAPKPPVVVPMPPDRPPPPVAVPVPPDPHAVMLKFGRTQCLGWCPAYQIAVHRDGAIEYHGDDFVKTKGDATGKLSPDQIAELDKLFATKDVPNKDFTNYDVTDNPSAEFQYASPTGKLISVKHYFGDTHAPPILREVEEGIDRIVKIDTWIGTEAERKKLSGH